MSGGSPFWKFYPVSNTAFYSNGADKAIIVMDLKEDPLALTGDFDQSGLIVGNVSRIGIEIEEGANKLFPLRLKLAKPRNDGLPFKFPFYPGPPGHFSDPASAQSSWIRNFHDNSVIGGSVFKHKKAGDGKSSFIQQYPYRTIRHVRP